MINYEPFDCFQTAFFLCNTIYQLKTANYQFTKLTTAYPK